MLQHVFVCSPKTNTIIIAGSLIKDDIMLSFLCYGFFGLLGFAVDFCVFNMLFELSNTHLISRFLSYTLATSITWLLNTTYTFNYQGSDRYTLKSYLRYFFSQVPAILINIGLHMSFVTFFGQSILVISIIFVLNGVIALILNFTLSKFYVFKH